MDKISKFLKICRKESNRERTKKRKYEEEIEINNIKLNKKLRTRNQNESIKNLSPIELYDEDIKNINLEMYEKLQVMIFLIIVVESFIVMFLN